MNALLAWTRKIPPPFLVALLLGLALLNFWWVCVGEWPMTIANMFAGAYACWAAWGQVKRMSPGPPK